MRRGIAGEGVGGPQCPEWPRAAANCPVLLPARSVPGAVGGTPGGGANPQEEDTAPDAVGWHS